MMPTSLIPAVAPRTRKIIKKGLNVYGYSMKLVTKWYIKLCIYVRSIVRNRIRKLEFTEMKYRKNVSFLKGT